MGAAEAIAVLERQHADAVASARDHKRLAQYHRRLAARRMAQAEHTRAQLAALGVRMMNPGEVRQERHGRHPEQRPRPTA